MTAPATERGLLHYLGLGASAGLLGIMLLIAGAVIVVPAATNSTTYTVLTSSMEPKLPPGTLIVSSPVAIEDIRVGDVLTYQLESGKPTVVTHRVTAITTTGTGSKLFTLKGDSNSLPDANLVLPEQVRGKLWYSVPFIGWVNNIVTGPARGWLLPALAFGLFLYAGYMVASYVAAQLKKRRLVSAAVKDSDLP
ncbi:MAG: signal peptidase I [Rhodoglobus sp.]